MIVLLFAKKLLRLFHFFRSILFFYFIFMRKIQSVLLSLAFFCSMLAATPSAKAENANLEDLINAIENSLEKKTMQVESETDLIWGPSKITVSDTFKKNDQKTSNQSSVGFVFDVDSLTEELLADLDVLSDDFLLKIDAEAKTFFDRDSGDFFYEISDYDLDLTTSDKKTKQVIEGFFELTQLLTGETYYINFETLAKNYPDLEEISEMLSAQNITGEDFALLFEALLRCGILEVTYEDGFFVITLAEEISTLDQEVLVEMLEKTDFFSGEEKTMILDEFSQELTEAQYSEINGILQQINTYADFEIKVDVNNEVVVGLEMTGSLDLATLAQQEDLKPLTLLQTVEIDYSKPSITFPKKVSVQIDLNKIAEMILAINESWMKNLSEEMDAFNEGFENGFEGAITEEAQVQDEVNSYDTNAWYAPFVSELVSQGIMPKLNNATAKITNGELEDLIYNATWVIYNQTGTDYYVFNSELANNPNQNITKYDALETIVKTFFPEEKYPVGFAVKNGIVSPQFNVGQACEQEVLWVEVAKMLKLTMDLVEKE